MKIASPEEETPEEETPYFQDIKFTDLVSSTLSMTGTVYV
jgi:hypothetical protein